MSSKFVPWETYGAHLRALAMAAALTALSVLNWGWLLLRKQSWDQSPESRKWEPGWELGQNTGTLEPGKWLSQAGLL